MFQKAERKKAKLRLAIEGPSGSGKTYSALLVARGVVGKKGKIAVIDTERGSADLYCDLTPFDSTQFTPPFSPEKYIAAIKEAEKQGYDAIVIDSLSHAWNAEGGILSLHDKAVKASRSGNSFMAWKDVTPVHNRLVDAILGANIHVIVTMRTKTEYSQEKDEKGKTQIKKVGTAPIQREGIEYEFTLVLDVNQDHIASASKDRTTMFDGQHFIPTIETGECLARWLNEGKDEPAPTPQQEPETVTPAQQAIATPAAQQEQAQQEPVTRDATGVPEPKRAEKKKDEPTISDEQVAEYRTAIAALQNARGWTKEAAVTFHKQVLAIAKVDELKKLTVEKFTVVMGLIDAELAKGKDDGGIN